MRVKNSHHVAEVEHDGSALVVKHKNGYVYRYAGVPARIMLELELANERGKSVGTLIKSLVEGKYDAERIA